MQGGRGRNPGVHGFSEILYAFSSAGNNKAARLRYLGRHPFYNVAWRSPCGWAVSGDRGGARHCRLAGRQEAHPGERRHHADARRDLRDPADRTVLLVGRSPSCRRWRSAIVEHLMLWH